MQAAEQVLLTLRIQDYALIDDQSIEFAPGLNVLTGETGTGKSIIIGALSLILGERADPEVIRSGREAAVVEASFEPGSLPAAAAELLDELALRSDAENGLTIRRRVVRAGRGSILVNDLAVTQPALRRLGDALVDLHGQHEHQSLLNPELHRSVLDDYAGLAAQAAGFAERFRELRNRESELTRLQAEVKLRQDRRELTGHAFTELSEAQLTPDEPERLTREKELLDSAEKRLALTRELGDILAEGEGAVQELLSGAQRRLTELAELDGRLAAGRADLDQAAALVEEVWRALLKYQSGIETTPGRLDEINERLYRLERLVRKYRPEATVSDRAALEWLIARQAELGVELSGLEVDETKVRELEALVERTEKKLLRDAAELSKARKAAAGRLERRLARECAAVGLADARIQVRIDLQPDPDGRYIQGRERYRLTAQGLDAVELRFSANPGEDVRPLQKVASGGELSRVMLALKGVMSAEHQVPVMVFDEIDAGIGGRIAEVVGRKLAELARARQVICITHLPQIARFAQAHFRVSKSVQGGRTSTRVSRLNPEERVEEVARMLAGAEVTRTVRAHARELLGSG